MDKLIAYLRARGTRRLDCDVILENQGMRRLALALGFVEQPLQEGDRSCHLTLWLQPAAAA